MCECEPELSVAHGIQATLVPDICFSDLKIWGVRQINPQYGDGRRFDRLHRERRWKCDRLYRRCGRTRTYPGHLMGTLKAVLRVSCRFRQQPSLCPKAWTACCLPSKRQADMYATLALLYFNSSSDAEYTLAGHLPILHYRHQHGDTTRLSMEQFPTGTDSRWILYKPARQLFHRVTLFLLFTRWHYGSYQRARGVWSMARLERLLCQHAVQPLSQIWVIGHARM